MIMNKRFLVTFIYMLKLKPAYQVNMNNEHLKLTKELSALHNYKYNKISRQI